jgi:SAM-dependent methyltransferase
MSLMPPASRGAAFPGAVAAVIEQFRARRRPAAVDGGARPPSHEEPRLTEEALVGALYRALLGRDADPEGLAGKVEALRAGGAIEDIARDFVESDEFYARMLRRLVPASALPDLTRIMPDRYRPAPPAAEAPLLYLAPADADIERMEALIREHRYYDRFDVWSPVVDLDKILIAEIVRGLGARSCFEMGCFTGPVLSLLAESGITVAGCEISHTALAFAYPNIRGAIRYGDLRDLEIDRKFDVALCMDVLEHLSPLRLDGYIARLASLLAEDGRVYLNSPMFGPDPVFGAIAALRLDSWRSIGDSGFWREWPCDESGWPLHGHLIWASPNWWTARFAAHGLERDVAVEQVIHHRLRGFFAQTPGRRMLFVLRRADSRRDPAAVAAALDAHLAAVAAAS